MLHNKPRLIASVSFYTIALNFSEALFAIGEDWISDLIETLMRRMAFIIPIGLMTFLTCRQRGLFKSVLEEA